MSKTLFSMKYKHKKITLKYQSKEKEDLVIKIKKPREEDSEKKNKWAKIFSIKSLIEKDRYWGKKCESNEELFAFLKKRLKKEKFLLTKEQNKYILEFEFEYKDKTRKVSIILKGVVGLKKKKSESESEENSSECSKEKKKKEARKKDKKQNESRKKEDIKDYESESENEKNSSQSSKGKKKKEARKKDKKQNESQKKEEDKDYEKPKKLSQFRNLDQNDEKLLGFFFDIWNKNYTFNNEDFSEIIDGELSYEDFENKIQEKKGALPILAPYIADAIKRKTHLGKIKEILSKMAFNNKQRLKLNQISQRNLIEFLLQTSEINVRSMIGICLMEMFTYIPFSYWSLECANFIKKLNFDPSLLYLIKFDAKPVVLNFGLDSNIGKTFFMTELLPINQSRVNLRKNGILRTNTIDLYVLNQCLLFDLNESNFEDPLIIHVLSSLMRFIHIVIIHVLSKNSKNFIKTMQSINLEIKDKNILILERDTSNSNLKQSSLNFLEKNNKVEIFQVENLQEMAEEFRSLSLESIKKNFASSLENLKLDKENIFDPIIFESMISDAGQKFIFESKNISKIISNFYKKNDSLMNTFLPFSELKFNIFKKKRNGDELTVIIKEMENFKWKNFFFYEFANILIKKGKIEISILDNKLKVICESFLNPKIKERNQLFDKLSEITDKKHINDSSNTKLAETYLKQMHLLTEEINNNNVNFYTLVNEIFYFYDHYQSLDYKQQKTQEDILFWKTLKSKYAELINSGINTHLLKMNPCEIEHSFLKEIFKEEACFQGKKYFVISILGIQSSAKSTLLNYLFGTNFETNAGKCTNGIYFSIIKTKIPNINILLLDTEGLSSVEGQDKLFDNQMALMCFGISNLVLINQKGEISKYLNELLEVSVYAMGFMSVLKETKCKIFFILRDQVQRDPEKQEVSVKIVKKNLQEIASKYGFSLEDILEINISNFILLPSAFQENLIGKKEEKSRSELFSQEILVLRKKIFDEILIQKGKKNLENQTIQYLYSRACSLWKSLSEYGIDILNCKSLREYEQKNEVINYLKEECVNSIKKIKRKINNSLDQDFEEMMKNRKKQIFDYQDLILNLFKDEINDIISKTQEKFSKIEKYMIQTCLDETRDVLESEKRNLLSEWSFKMKIFDNLIETQNFNENIRLKMEKEIANFVDNYYQEENNEKFVENVQCAIQNITVKFRNQISQNYKLNIDPKEILRNCLLVYNKNKLDHWKAINLNEFKTKNKSETEWINLSWCQFKNKVKYLISESERNKKLNELKEFCVNHLTLFINNYEKDCLSDEICITFCQKVQNFVLDPKNSGAINIQVFTTDIAIDFLNSISDKISKNQKKMQEEEIQKAIRAIDKIEKENIELFRSRKDQIGIVNELAKMYLKSLKKFIKTNDFEMEFLNVFNQELGNLPQGPKDFLEYAYKKSFAEKNIDNVLKFVFDVNKFCKEVFSQQILLSKKSQIEIALQKFYIETLEAERKRLLLCLKEFISSQSTDKMILKDFNVQVTKHFNTRITVHTVYENKIFEISDFEKAFSKGINYFDFGTEKIKSKIEKLIKNSLSEKEDSIIGCQIVCPYCHSKCIKPAGNNHKNHEAFHLLNGFGGTHFKGSLEVSLDFCLDPKNINQKWASSNKDRDSYDNLLKKLEIESPEWLDDFRENSKKKILQDKEKNEQLELWYAVRNPILKKYQIKDSSSIPSNIISLLKSCEEDYKIKGWD